MPTYRRRTLGEVQNNPPLDPLRGGQLMRRSRVSAVHRAGDNVLSHGRRIIATCGLHGAKSWHMGDTASGGATQTKPLRDVERVVLRTPAVLLTPGHFLRASIVALPSGETERGPLIPVAYVADGVHGAVKVDVTYDNGTTTSTVSQTTVLPGSTLANGSQPTGAGAAWNSLITRLPPPIFPADLNVPANLAAWSNGVTATVTVSYIGSPRVVDLVVHEEPHALCVDVNDGDAIAPMHSKGQGEPLPKLPGTVPKIRYSSTDAHHGAEALCDAARRLSQEIGPILFFHTAWDEDAQLVASTETDYRTITTVGTSLTELVTGATTNASNLRPGWSVSSGSNGTRIQDLIWGTHSDKTKIVPVRFWVYGTMSVNTGPTATIRFAHTASHTYTELAIPSNTAWQWHTAPGHLRCGMAAQDPTTYQVAGSVSTGTGSPQFRWRYIACTFDGTL